MKNLYLDLRLAGTGFVRGDASVARSKTAHCELKTSC